MGSYNRINRTYHKTMMNLERIHLEGDKPELTEKWTPYSGLILWVQGWEGFMGSYNRFDRTYHKTMINLDRFPLEGDKPELTLKWTPYSALTLWVQG